jgi:histidinol dehydrogenase
MTLRRIAPNEPLWAQAPHDLSGVTEIVEAVRAGGDAAVARFAQRFGDPPPRRISPDEMASAADAVDVQTLELIRRAAKRIRRFAQAQRAALHDVAIATHGMEIGHRAIPLERAGIYVPGGRYPLPSTVLMCAIPARVAGVASVVLCTPNASAQTLAAAHEAGVDACYEIGGAQAIAAMAFGTETIPKVDLIAGPGNAYVTAAKRQVYGVCGVDMLAGPSELVVIASAGARADLVAADLLAQAEHDPMARVMLLTDDAALADSVDAILQQRLATLSTADTARAALEGSGCCAILPLDRAVERANAIAPEHLALHGAAAESLEPGLHSYGSLFVGPLAAQAFGDYGIGANHVLPTGGSARFTSGLSVLTFLKLRTYLRSGTMLDSEIVHDTAAFARIEGLTAHGEAALQRLPEPIARG